MASITNEEIHRLVAGQTVASGFLGVVNRLPDQIAVRQRSADGGWAEWTYAQFAAEVAAWAGGLRQLGVEPGDRVVLMLRNTAEFHFVDVAAVFCGATPISIYNSSSPEQVAYLAGHSQAKVAVVEDAGLLERFLKVREELPGLKALVLLQDNGMRAGRDITLAAHLLAQSEPLNLADAASLVTPDSLATVIYTSGTTGPPKGVMISHRNVMWTVESLRRAFGPDMDLIGKRLVSYLPMAHIAERTVSHYNLVTQGREVSCCPDAGMLVPYLKEVHPHILFGVPRVWEKIHAAVTASLAADPPRAAMFDEAVATATPIGLARSWGESTPEQDRTWEVLQDTVFQSVKASLGLDQVEFGITGAAPIPRQLIEWYNAIGVPLSEIYGMSECTGPMTWIPTRIKPGTVGPAIPGCDVALAGDGEIICRGGNVVVGYLDDPSKTAEAIDDEGWLHSGDIGVLDDDGYVKVVDRKKELIITAGGKNISPANLEAAIKTLPLVGQACAVGDRRPFVAALVVLDPEVAPVWAKQRQIDYETLADLAIHPEVVAEIERGVADAMQPFNNAEQVKKLHIVGEEWLPDSDVLTPTSKLKRRGVHGRYAEEIERLYSGVSQSTPSGGSVNSTE
jgi:long-chain acyl-CoA synthetase